MPLSTKQMEYLALAWQCFETEPKIDYAKFATVAGLKNANSARELMRVAKNKLKAEYGAMSEGMKASNVATLTGTPTKTTAAATPGSKKRGRKPKPTENGAEGSEGEGGDGGEEGESPTKKKKKAAGGVAVVKREETEEDAVEAVFQ